MLVVAGEDLKLIVCGEWILLSYLALLRFICDDYQSQQIMRSIYTTLINTLINPSKILAKGFYKGRMHTDASYYA
jgi:hypothetical protein